MKNFLDENFLLENKTAQRLFHDFARKMPVIDYHCHLPPELIAADSNFENLTQAWLSGDHYKWRAMRTNGVSEEYCTGSRPDRDKFQKWAETVPYTLRNPLYHWTHLELQRYFNVSGLLEGKSAAHIYETCNELLQSREYSVRHLLRKMNVTVLCTTDDPADTLESHRKIKDDGFEIKILPTFRPDRAMEVENASAFNSYLGRLEAVCQASIHTYADYLDALRSRHDYFALMGCRLSDHGLEKMFAEDYLPAEIEGIFNRVRSGKELQPTEISRFKSAMLHVFGE
ncbi:MAG: glucuronate isomerase, partial [Flavisolibacter sp.]